MVVFLPWGKVFYVFHHPSSGNLGTPETIGNPLLYSFSYVVCLPNSGSPEFMELAGPEGSSSKSYSFLFA